MVRLTRWIIGLSVLTALLAVGATTFAGLQWLSQVQQIQIAKDAAASSAKDTQEALNQAKRAAKAAEDQARVTAAALKISGRLATAGEAQARAGRALASTTATQLAQNVNLFAAQQRPVIGFDPAQFPKDGPLLQDDVMNWNYGYTNFGVGPAFDIVIHEALSVYDGPFREEIRSGGRILVPGAKGQWSTASYEFKPGELVAHRPFNTIIRVRFDYKDVLGRRYTSGFCYALNRFNIKVDCSSWSSTQYQRDRRR